MTRFAGVHPNRVLKLVYLDAATDRAGLPEILKQMPPEWSPTETDMESLDSLRRFTKRMNNSWSEAWEATLREQFSFSSDGKILNVAERDRPFGLLIQGAKDSHPDYTKIRSPALSIAVVGLTSKMLDLVKILPESRRKEVDEFSGNITRFGKQQLERFRKEVPNGRVIEFTNTDHHCFIHREVLRAGLIDMSLAAEHAYRGVLPYRFTPEEKNNYCSDYGEAARLRGA